MLIELKKFLKGGMKQQLVFPCLHFLPDFLFREYLLKLDKKLSVIWLTKRECLLNKQEMLLWKWQVLLENH